LSRFEVHALPIEGVQRIRRLPLEDARGFLARLFCAEELAPAGWVGRVQQINHTLTRETGSVRGLHYQRPPHAETKLVSCLAGKVWDVVVDLRPHSPTYLKWHAEELSADNHAALLIPQGVAHGFQALEPDVQLLYLHSQAYAPQAEAGLNPLDPRLAIEWPLPVRNLSERDSRHPLLSADFVGVTPI
jgi:dTDP-4-dehydrorhamnose 3,5-epimerase